MGKSQPSQEEILAVLGCERNSPEITEFALTWPDVQLRSRSYVLQHWHLFRNHVSISKFSIESNTSITVQLPSWLGGHSFTFDFWDNDSTMAAVDCMAMYARYNTILTQFENSVTNEKK